MTITIPEPFAAQAQAKAKAAGFTSVEHYIIDLVVADRSEPDAELPDYAGHPDITPRNRAELEAMIDAGYEDGPVVEATPEFWEERKRVLAERMAKRRGQQP